MDPRSLVPGVVLEGPGLSEPLEIFTVSPIGSDVQITGLGRVTGGFHHAVWTAGQLAPLQLCAPSSEAGLDPHRLSRTSLITPPDRENSFWYDYNASDTVIVFVHGIFSTSRSCWLSEANGRSVFWPDLLRVDPRFNAPSIYMAGYYTALDAGDFPLDQCARQVLEALERPDVSGRPPVLDKRNIVFVCHSTGGIVVRYLLCRYGKVFGAKGVGLALIASPSRGSVWANVAGMAARYYNQELGRQLEWGGETIEEIHSRFKDLVNARDTEMPGLFGMEACETKMVFRQNLPAIVQALLPNRLKVVTTESAGQYLARSSTCRTPTISRPSSRTRSRIPPTSSSKPSSGVFGNSSRTGTVRWTRPLCPRSERGRRSKTISTCSVKSSRTMPTDTFDALVSRMRCRSSSAPTHVATSS